MLDNNSYKIVFQMLAYNSLIIKRLVMHRILPKNPTRDHVEAQFSDHLVCLNDGIQSLIQDRLVDSCGRQGKAFNLSIKNDEVGSCFDSIKNLSSLDDEQFLEVSKGIAQLLADCQDTRIRIPGGYFLLVQAFEPCRNENVYIILKAEKQDALSEVDNSVQAVKNIFLSPAQKMYKAGVFEQVQSAASLSKDNFKAYLYDSQFNDGTKLANYFYRDFLGLSIDGNSQVQTKTFYDLFSNTIDTVFKGDIKNLNYCKEQLCSEMLNQSKILNARGTITRIIPPEMRDVFIAKVGEEFPNSFVKDCALIHKKLQQRIVLLTGSVKLSAPSESFINNDIIIESDPQNPTIKIIRIKVHEYEKEDT